MAQRRMFNKSIVCSGRFLKMPPTARLLYYDLCMAADDDGVSEAFTVMRMTGCAEDDLRVLIAKNYVKMLDDEELIVYIVDWTESNSIPAQKYKRSFYSDLLKEKTGILPKYTESIPEVNSSDTEGKQEVYGGKTQVSIGQDRSGQDRSGQVITANEKLVNYNTDTGGAGGETFLTGDGEIDSLYQKWKKAVNDGDNVTAAGFSNQLYKLGFYVDKKTGEMTAR